MRRGPNGKAGRRKASLLLLLLSNAAATIRLALPALSGRERGPTCSAVGACAVHVRFAVSGEAREGQKEKERKKAFRLGQTGRCRASFFFGDHGTQHERRLFKPFLELFISSVFHYCCCFQFPRLFSLCLKFFLFGVSLFFLAWFPGLVVCVPLFSLLSQQSLSCLRRPCKLID